jgi:hypothetical protein
MNYDLQYELNPTRMLLWNIALVFATTEDNKIAIPVDRKGHFCQIIWAILFDVGTRKLLGQSDEEHILNKDRKEGQVCHCYNSGILAWDRSLCWFSVL